MNQSNEIGELAKALAQAQGEMTPAAFDAVNPHYKSKYSKLPAIWEVCRGPLSKNSLCIMQTLSESENKIYLTTILAHSSGQWVKSVMPIISTKADNHGMTSGITYAKRNALVALLGIVSDDDYQDDDGNACVKEQANLRRPIVQKITREQADELHSMFDKCPENFRKYVLNKISQEMKIGTFYELPSNCYDALRLSIEQNMQKQIEVSK